MDPSPIMSYSRSSRPVRRLFSWTLTLYAASIVFVLIAGSMLARPVSAIYKDFNVELSGMSKAVLSFSLFLSESWTWVLLLPIPFIFGTLGGMFVASTPDPEGQRLRLRLVRTLLMLMSAAVALIYIGGLMLPLYSLTEGMSGAGKR